MAAIGLVRNVSVEPNGAEISMATRRAKYKEVAPADEQLHGES